jgi:predicted NUDIX family phosphoesterase
MSSEERVLVVPRSVFDGVGSFQGFCGEPEPYLNAFFQSGNNGFAPRSEVETDPSRKQIIPYAVFRHGDRILHYVRGGKGGERRLLAKGSIGIGGHINDSDVASECFDAQAYRRAVDREIGEELRIQGGFTDRIVGLINDDSSEVGRVHLGVVHLVELNSDQVSAGEAVIEQPEFLSVDELGGRADSLETWSQIVLANWAEICPD